MVEHFFVASGIRRSLFLERRRRDRHYPVGGKIFNYKIKGKIEWCRESMWNGDWWHFENLCNSKQTNDFTKIWSIVFVSTESYYFLLATLWHFISSIFSEDPCAAKKNSGEKYYVSSARRPVIHVGWLGNSAVWLGNLKKKVWQSTFLLFCCCDEKFVHGNFTTICQKHGGLSSVAANSINRTLAKFKYCFMGYAIK